MKFMNVLKIEQNQQKNGQNGNVYNIFLFKIKMNIFSLNFIKGIKKIPLSFNKKKFSRFSFCLNNWTLFLHIF